jgi:hypothetical protein
MVGNVVVAGEAFRKRVSCVPVAPHGHRNQAFPQGASAEKALRELITIKGDVEYGTKLITLAKAEPLVRRAETLVGLARQIVRPGH